MPPKNFRILPLLILVAMLAFSVRLADVIIGVSSFSGEARAEDPAKTEEHKPAEAMDAGKTDEAKSAPEKPGGLKFIEEEKPAEEKSEKPKEEEKKMPEVESPEWRDASDTDFGYEQIRSDLEQDLGKRRAELDKREKELMTQEALLKAADKELNQKYQEMLKLRKEIENLLERQSKEEQERIASLVKIYEGMKPKDAARIFNTLDLDVLISVMSKMSERKLSGILSQMDPERAQTVTIMLAEQKKLPDLPDTN